MLLCTWWEGIVGGKRRRKPLDIQANPISGDFASGWARGGSIPFLRGRFSGRLGPLGLWVMFYTTRRWPWMASRKTVRLKRWLARATAGV